jgi:hypothetical protein
VLPLVGCPRWLIWFGTLLAVVLYVVGRRLLPSIGEAIVEAWRNAKVEPAPPPVSDGGSADDERRRTDAPAQPEVTDKIADLREPGRDAG